MIITQFLILRLLRLLLFIDDNWGFVKEKPIFQIKSIRYLKRDA
jgi:hypothetical protein